MPCPVKPAFTNTPLSSRPTYGSASCENPIVPAQRSVVDARAGRDRSSGKRPHVARGMELAVVLVDGGALARHDADAHRLRPQTVGALAHLAPFLVISGDLRRTLPGEVTPDRFARDDLADELLVVSGEAPDAHRSIFAIPARRRDEILGDPREEKPGVSPARRFGDRASLEDDRLHTGSREVIGGRDARDASADDRDVRGGVLIERRMVVGCDFVEPDARHFRYSA